MKIFIYQHRVQCIRGALCHGGQEFQVLCGRRITTRLKQDKGDQAPFIYEWNCDRDRKIREDIQDGRQDRSGGQARRPGLSVENLLVSNEVLYKRMLKAKSRRAVRIMSRQPSILF